MTFDHLIKGRQYKPRKTLLYGTEGIGKSTFMAQWPDTVFISTEDGLADIDCVRYPEARSYSDVYDALMELYTSDSPFKHVAIDSGEGLERLIHAKVCDDGDEKGKRESIEEFGFGRGYKFALKHWETILKGMDALNGKGMHISLICHAEVSRFNNPEGDDYDRYSLRLHKASSALVKEWATEVLFGSYETIVRKDDVGFGKTKARGVGNGNRIVKTTARPAFDAKNRLQLPDEMPLDFEIYKQYLRTEAAQKA